MTDDAKTPADAPAETAMQRALRLKKEALGRRSQPGQSFKREQNAKAPAGQSKPWMSR